MLKTINIFISYRRKDSKANARSLYLAIKDDFEVFFDIDKDNSISYGQNFPQRIKQGIKESDLFIPIIGKEFASELNKREGKLDWVFEEILLAKNLKKNFLPIFIDDAFMPNTNELPKNIAFICEIDSFSLSHDKFEQDIKTIKRAIRKITYNLTPSTSKNRILKKSIFKQLEIYLQLAQWKKATVETTNIFLKISKREKYGWLRINDIKTVSCDTIFHINQLWEKYSGYRFGFNKQLELIKENNLSINTVMGYKYFAETVLWYKDLQWNYRGDEEIVGSFPLPISFNHKLSINKDSFQTLLEKFRECQKSI